MLFRIEDISGFDTKTRTYNIEEHVSPFLSKEEVDSYIARKIREEINGSKNRSILSYSKSLATCILKYNKFTDNELHIYSPEFINKISYKTSKNNEKQKSYMIQNRIGGKHLFNNKSGKIQLLNFVIDVSNNSLVDQYLRYYTNVGMDPYASPEKDKEVVVMNPTNDLIINQYMDAVYILYALQLKYNFLGNIIIRKDLLMELDNLDTFRFKNPDEKKAFIKLIIYLCNKWNIEKLISQRIYNYSKKEKFFLAHYDPILQFHGIMRDSFEDSYHLKTYNENILSDLFWKYCARHLEY